MSKSPIGSLHDLRRQFQDPRAGYHRIAYKANIREALNLKENSSTADVIATYIGALKQLNPQLPQFSASTDPRYNTAQQAATICTALTGHFENFKLTPEYTAYTATYGEPAIPVAPGMPGVAPIAPPVVAAPLPQQPPVLPVHQPAPIAATSSSSTRTIGTKIKREPDEDEPTTHMSSTHTSSRVKKREIE